MEIWVSPELVGKSKIKVFGNPPVFKGGSIEDFIMKNWNFIEGVLGERAMPNTPLGDHTLGSGMYGSVFSSKSPSLVFKVTTDKTEGKFIEALLPLIKEKKSSEKGLVGLVKYYGIIMFPMPNSKHKIYMLVREKVLHPGYRGIMSFYIDRLWRERILRKDTYDRDMKKLEDNGHNLREYMERLASLGGGFFFLMKKMKWKSREFQGGLHRGLLIKRTDEEWENHYITYRHYHAKWSRQPEGVQVKLFVGLLAQQARMMRDGVWVVPHDRGKFWMGKLIGRTMSYLLRNGIVIADLHEDNIGLVLREEEPVIMDPGHAIPKKFPRRK